MKTKYIWICVIAIISLAVLLSFNARNDNAKVPTAYSEQEQMTDNVPRESDVSGDDELNESVEDDRSDLLSPQDMQDALEQENMEAYKAQMAEEIQNAMNEDYEDNMPHGFPY